MLFTEKTDRAFYFKKTDKELLTKGFSGEPKMGAKTTFWNLYF